MAACRAERSCVFMTRHAKSPDVTCQEGSVEEITALCDISCQVTRGRTPDWADTPLATWLRTHIEARGKDKSWLSAEMVRRGGARQGAADARVNRWTYLGKPPTAATLAKNLVTELTEIFGEPPPGAQASAPLGPRVSSVESALAALESRVAELGHQLGELRRQLAPKGAARRR